MRRYCSRTLAMLPFALSLERSVPFSVCISRQYACYSHSYAYKTFTCNSNNKDSHNKDVWPSVYFTQHRHINWKAKLHSLTSFRITEEHANPMRSSRVAEVGFDHNTKGYDPVWNYETFKKVSKPMDKTVISSLDDYLDKRESEKWMNVKTAATILGIKEVELPTLTHEKLTEKWESAYRSNRSVRREEIVLAAEELLSYLDSALHEKKNKAHYRRVIQSIRNEMDAESRAKREFWINNFIWILCVFLGGSTVLFVGMGVWLRLISIDQVRDWAESLKRSVYTELFVPNNVEPPPDYNTRYFTTPSAMEIDQRAGRLERTKAFANSHTMTMMEEKDAFDKQEEMEILKLMNDENERREREIRAREIEESRVAVLLPSEVAANHGNPISTTGNWKNTETEKTHAQVSPSSSLAAKVSTTAINGDNSVDTDSSIKETFQERYRKVKMSLFGDPDFHFNTQKNVLKAAALDEMQRRMQSVKNNNDNVNVS